MATEGCDNISYMNEGPQSQVNNNNAPKQNEARLKENTSGKKSKAQYNNPHTSEKRTKSLEFEEFPIRHNKEDEEYQELQRTWFSVWNRHCLLIGAYFTGVLLFIMFYHIKTLPAMPYPMSGNLLDWDPDMVPYIWWTEGSILVELMWGFTHIRKTIIIIMSAWRHEAATTHIQLHVMKDIQTDCMGMPRCLSTMVIGYHVIIGIWLGWANNVFSGYNISEMEFVISGLCIYFAAESVIIIGSGYYLYKKQTESRLFRRLRLGAEVFSWTGFGLVSMTLPAVFVFFMRFALLIFFLIIPDRPYCCR